MTQTMTFFWDTFVVGVIVLWSNSVIKWAPVFKLLCLLSHNYYLLCKQMLMFFIGCCLVMYASETVCLTFSSRELNSFDRYVDSTRSPPAQHPENESRWQATHLLCLTQCSCKYMVVCGRVVSFGCPHAPHPTGTIITKENSNGTFARTIQGLSLTSARAGGVIEQPIALDGLQVWDDFIYCRSHLWMVLRGRCGKDISLKTGISHFVFLMFLEKHERVMVWKRPETFSKCIFKKRCFNLKILTIAF